MNDADQRDAEQAMLDKAHGSTDAIQALETLCERADDLRWNLMEMPAPDLKTLHWKLDYILADDGTESTSGGRSSLIEPIRADMRRLLAGGGVTMRKFSTTEKLRPFL